MMNPFKAGNDSMNKQRNKFNVKNTSSGVVHNSFNPNSMKSSKKSSTSKHNVNNKELDINIDTSQIFDQVFGNVRLSVRAVARLHAYQTLNKLTNRSDALNQIFDKFLPKAFDDDQMKRAKNIESLFEEKYKDNSKQYKRALKNLKKKAMKKAFKEKLNNN